MLTVHLDADLRSVHKRLAGQWNLQKEDVKVSRGRSSVGERIRGMDDVALWSRFLEEFQKRDLEEFQKRDYIDSF